MKYCEKYVPALSALVDGELSDIERAEVLAHLEACEPCRELLAELTAMHDAMGELEEYDAPAGFTDSVLARLHEAPAAKKRTPRAAWLSLAACAAIVVLAVGGPLRSQLGAKPEVGNALPETMMMTVAESEEYAEEEYTDEFTSVQSAPMTMKADSESPAESEAAREANGFDAPGENAMEGGEAGSAANDALFANEADPTPNDALFANETELPRSVVFVYGAAREDYLIEEAVSFDYYADGAAAGYDLPTEKLDELLALLDADGVEYDESVVAEAATFYVQYEEGNTNG